MNLSAGTSSGWLRRLAIATYALVAIDVVVLVCVWSLPWINRSFPGFFIMENLVIPSVSLRDWTGVRGDSIYQHQVVAVDGEPVDSPDAIYERVAAAPPGTEFRYTLRTDSGINERLIESMRFGVDDYITIFGAYLLNGIVFTGVGIAIWILGPRSPTTVGAIVLTLNAGMFCLSAVDIYSPANLFRLHTVTEGIFPASLLHLMLVFPAVRFSRHRRKLLSVVYLADLALIGFYQLHLYDLHNYSMIHNYSLATCGLVGVGLIGSAIHAQFASTSLLVRKRLGIVLLGLVSALAVPAWMFTVSGFSQAYQAINLAAFTVFFVALSLAYAVIKIDLFEIDAMLRRGINAFLLTLAVGATYAILVVGLGFVLQTASLAYSPAVPLVFSFLMIVIFTPMRDRIQKAVDRLYYRTSYNVQKTLERASGALVGTLSLDEIYTLTIKTICEALLIDEASLWLMNEHGQLAGVRGRGARHAFRGTLAVDHPLVKRLREGKRAVSSYDFMHGLSAAPAERACQVALRGLHAELVLPLGVRDDLMGLIALGPKKSQTLFTLDDLDFLHTFANHVAVAILNAQSFRKIEELNVNLERRVAQRTNELAATNQELAHSLHQLEQAYDELRQSQEDLGRAEKMAALGRLTAGIAHEVNTPLGASLNSLKIITEVVNEYSSAIGDPEVSESDHRAMAAELGDLVGNVFKWTTKAAAYVRSIKAHTRTLEGLQARSFDVAQLVEDALLLLSHRLRLSSCSVTVDCPTGITLFGDPAKLGQVLTNLITNAIDSYAEARTENGVIGIQVCPRSEHVEIVVWDRGCGIAPENVERIFDALFTTKESGKGTGLGLSIARDIITECFGGRIEVASTPGVGSFFTLWIPRRQAGATNQPDAEPAAETPAVM